MTPLLTELEPLVRTLLDRHLATAVEWFPHQLVPYDLGTQYGDTPWQAADSPFGPAVRTALQLNLLTAFLAAAVVGFFEDTVKALESKGTKAWGRSVDVKDTAALRSWVESAAAALGGVDILVTNASALSFGLSIEAFRAAFDVDLFTL